MEIDKMKISPPDVILNLDISGYTSSGDQVMVQFNGVLVKNSNGQWEFSESMFVDGFNLVVSNRVLVHGYQSIDGTQKPIGIIDSDLTDDKINPFTVTLNDSTGQVESMRQLRNGN